MPLINRVTAGNFIPRLYGGVGCLQAVRLLKRGDDQQQGTVTSYLLFDVRRRMITKAGQTVQGDMSSDHRVTWVIPKSELERVGVSYLSALDRIVDEVEGGTWQPESDTIILVKLMGFVVNLDCKRTDPQGV